MLLTLMEQVVTTLMETIQAKERIDQEDEEDIERSYPQSIEAYHG